MALSLTHVILKKKFSASYYLLPFLYNSFFHLKIIYNTKCLCAAD